MIFTLCYFIRVYQVLYFLFPEMHPCTETGLARAFCRVGEGQEPLTTVEMEITALFRVVGLYSPKGTGSVGSQTAQILQIHKWLINKGEQILYKSLRQTTSVSGAIDMIEKGAA